MGETLETGSSEGRFRFLSDFNLGADDVARAAILLAITKDALMEAACKQRIEEQGWRVVATEVGGLLSDLPQKIVRALVGASLNAGIIEKNSREMHALIHAAIEAGDSFVNRGIVELSVGAKIAIVRNNNWLAVAIFGDCAAHIVAHHDRCGLGVMHL
ncbi:MAG: HutP family protein [Synergistaceae bacterium]|nr:HutP family protein [Synergistaceae bacterium]